MVGTRSAYLLDRRGPRSPPPGTWRWPRRPGPGSVLLVNGPGPFPRGRRESLAVIGPAGWTPCTSWADHPSAPCGKVVTPWLGSGSGIDRVRVEHAQGSWGDVPLRCCPPCCPLPDSVPGRAGVQPRPRARHAGPARHRIEPGLTAYPPAGFDRMAGHLTTVLTPPTMDPPVQPGRRRRARSTWTARWPRRGAEAIGSSTAPRTPASRRRPGRRPADHPGRSRPGSARCSAARAAARSRLGCSHRTAC
jgi:hypothetical protein